MWEASGLRARLRLGGERLSAINRSVPPLMRQEAYTFACLAIQLLHRTWGEGARQMGKITLVPVLFANGVLEHILKCLIKPKELTSG